jgi:hypothetical protein
MIKMATAQECLWERKNSSLSRFLSNGKLVKNIRYRSKLISKLINFEFEVVSLEFSFVANFVLVQFRVQFDIIIFYGQLCQ